jgi:short-subunit dehydrogenase
MAGIETVVGKWVLVTGAASGIGLSTAQAFARRGANLVLTDVNPAALEQAAAGIAAMNVKCLPLVCDVGDEASVAQCAAAVLAAGLTPDILVNNAGVAFLGGFLETPLAQWQRTLNINVMGIVHMVRAFLPAMQAAGRPGLIVNIASTASYLPAANMSAYAASKGAVKLFSEVLAMELDGGNVSVQCVYPGIVNTAIVGGVKTVGTNVSAAQLARLQQYYLAKGCAPDVVGEDIARAAMAGTAHVYTGPMSWLGHVVSRISSSLSRKLSIKAARSSGYLPAAD